MNLPLFLILLLVCCGFALWRGGAPERAAASLQLGAYVVTVGINRLYDQPSFTRIAVGTAVLDVLLLIALVLLAWRSTRFWPLWIAGWQAAAICGHLSKLIDPGMLPTGYAVQAQFWAYPMLIATAAGAWRHRRRIVEGNDDPPWKTAAA